MYVDICDQILSDLFTELPNIINCTNFRKISNKIPMYVDQIIKIRKDYENFVSGADFNNCAQLLNALAICVNLQTNPIKNIKLFILFMNRQNAKSKHMFCVHDLIPEIMIYYSSNNADCIIKHNIHCCICDS